MPTILTIWIAKAILALSRATGRGSGGALPGLVAERIDPAIGRKLARRLRDGSIIITGTNGKTTTSKMIRQILEDNGRQLVSNRAGSNLSRGVVSALMEHVSWTGRMRGDSGLFEVDEAAMPALAAMLQPKLIVVLNLFRDQLDRYGELDTTAALVGRGIACTKADVYLNADDPLVASLAKYVASPEKVHYFGLEAVPVKPLGSDATADSTNCPVCGRALVYDKVFFGHIGHYSCPVGHFDRPNAQVATSSIHEIENGSTFKINSGTTKSLAVEVQLPGTYNIYNATAAAAVGLAMGVEHASITKSLGQTVAAYGRVEKVEVDGKQLYLLLIKNPTGFNQIIQTFLLQKKQQKIAFFINDNFADGRDVSWLWDSALEELAGKNHTIVTSGIRAHDMALRLKYADVVVDNVNESIAKTIDNFVVQIAPGEIGYLVPTYTAMREVRKYLSTKTELPEDWA